MAGPIEQFEIKSLLPIAEVGGHQISFTNSAAYMVLTVAIASLFLILSTRRHGLVPDRAQAAAEILYEFAAKTLRDNAAERPSYGQVAVDRPLCQRPIDRDADLPSCVAKNTLSVRVA